MSPFPDEPPVVVAVVHAAAVVPVDPVGGVVLAVEPVRAAVVAVLCFDPPEEQAVQTRTKMANATINERRNRRTMAPTVPSGCEKSALVGLLLTPCSYAGFELDLHDLFVDV